MNDNSLTKQALDLANKAVAQALEFARENEQLRRERNELLIENQRLRVAIKHVAALCGMEVSVL